MNGEMPGTATIFDESGEAIRRVKAGFAIVCAIQILNALADFNAKPQFAGRFSVVHGLTVVLLCAAVALTRAAWFARYWKLIAWLVCAYLLATGTVLSVVSHDVIPRFVSVLVFSLGCATFLPWGRFWQALLNLVCLISFAIDIAMVGEPSPHGAYLWIGVVAAVALAQFVAGFSERYREALVLSAREQAARAEAEAASRAKDEFQAMVAHELRNPLSSIMFALGLIRNRRPSPAARELTIIERQVKHLVRLVDDLLDVSRLTRGTIELKKEPVEIAEVAAKAVEMTNLLLEQRNQSLSVEIPRRGLVVEADPMRLAQVLSNLLNNAAKYTEPGGRITLGGRSEGGEVVVWVRDTGIGIEPEMLNKVFDQFVQHRQAADRSQEGLGLGLTIAKSLVTMHGGTVTAFSEGKGCGSQFTVRLPALARGEEAAALPTSGAERRAADSDEGGGRRVLVVDDNRDAAEMLARWLETNGHRTRIAHDGAAALRMVGDFGPDVALLDIGMPGMDGYELARKFREQPELARMRLLAVTGYGQEIDRQRSSAAGFDAHLVKPVDPELLESLIRRLCTSATRTPSQP